MFSFFNSKLVTQNSTLLNGGLYIHVPFCKKKCPYCDFSSIPYSKEAEAKYVKRLLGELKEKKRLFAKEPYHVKTLYVGGGTPSVLSLESITKIVEAVKEAFFREGPPVEATIECNPESSSLKSFKKFKELGFSRLSIGVQDLTERGLDALDRPHGVSEAKNAIDLAKEAGFEDISIDLIFGWPTQSKEELLTTLDLVATLKAVTHISYYELTIEENTKFYALKSLGRLEFLNQDTLWEFTEIIEDTLKGLGFTQYEISNFAKPGHEARHNIGYWKNLPYIGLGPSAVSYLPPRRWMNVRDLNRYLDTGLGEIPIEWEESLENEESFRETLVIGLRMVQGVSIKGLEMRYGINPFDYYGQTLYELMEDNFLEVENDYLFLTKKGRRVANEVLSKLV